MKVSDRLRLLAKQPTPAVKVAEHIMEFAAVMDEQTAALEGLMEIAQMAMPESYQQTDSRMAAARAALSRARGDTQEAGG